MKQGTAMSKTSAILAGSLLLFVLGLCLGAYFPPLRGKESVRVDTLTVERLIVDSAAVIEAQRAKGYELVRAVSLDSLKRLADKPARVDYIEDFVEVPVLVVRDSIVYVEVPITETTFAGKKDSVDYRITASGYDVTLDRVEFHYPERTIIRTETQYRRQRFGFAATAGPSVLVTPGGNLKAGAGVTLGLSLSF